tara:strand:+ start:412 stop:1113 length:702 start_codon:yes stop_codon:yes gene_type:complete
MNNTIIQLKIKQRLNKLDSQDYDNLECWQIVEAFNKGQVNWCRRNLHGLNVKQEGDEQSKRRIDDLQILLTDALLPLNNKDLHKESSLLPANYLEWKRLSGKASTDCCDLKSIVIYLAEEANVDELLRDKHKQPNFEWGETFCTLKGNKVKVFTNNKFDIDNVTLTYYRQPRRIEILGCVDPYTQTTSAFDVECEFKDDIIELFIDEAAKILAGDIESLNQQQTAQGQVEGNN